MSPRSTTLEAEWWGNFSFGVWSQVLTILLKSPKLLGRVSEPEVLLLKWELRESSPGSVNEPWMSTHLWGIVLLKFILLKYGYLQCPVNFYCTAKWFSYIWAVLIISFSLLNNTDMNYVLCSHVSLIENFLAILIFFRAESLSRDLMTRF